MADTYPMELKLSGRTCVVVGGGAVAARKVQALARAGAEVLVVAPEIDAATRAIPGVRLREERYAPSVLAGATLVFACTNDAAVNGRVADDARAAGAWVNVADDPARCDFFVPASLERGDLRITVSTGGASPQLAATIRRKLESSFGPEHAILVEELRRARAVVQDRIRSPEARRAVFEALCAEDSIRRLASEGPAAWREWMERIVQSS